MVLVVTFLTTLLGRTLLLALPEQAFLIKASNVFLPTLKTGNLPLAPSVCEVRIGTYSNAIFLRKSLVR